MSISMEELKRSIKEVVREELARENPQQPTESHAQHIIGCKDCYQEFGKLTKNFKHECSECHLPLPDSFIGEGTPPCPRCGSTEAKEV